MGKTRMEIVFIFLAILASIGTIRGECVREGPQTSHSEGWYYFFLFNCLFFFTISPLTFCTYIWLCEYIHTYI